MNTKLTLRSICCLAALGWAGAALPVSLGQLSGSTVVGRPLTLSAPIQFDEGTPAGCVNAELLYGDRSVDSSRVRVNLTHDAARQVSNATISSPAIVDEPVVTVLLHVGCTRPSTRRYVLLAEAPKDEPVTLAAASSIALPVAQPIRRAPVVALSRTAAATSHLKAVNATAHVRAAQQDSTAAPAARTVATRPVRLQLAVWEPGPGGSPWLRASTDLRPTPVADAAHRAAATALWRALSAQPQDLLRSADRLRGLEGEVSSLRGLAAQHRSDISSARESLQAARNDRYTNLALTILLALFAGAGAAFFWHRSRGGAAAAPVAGWNQVDPRGDAFVEEESESAMTPVKVEPAQLSAVDSIASGFPAPTRRPVVAAQPPVPLALAPLEFTAQQPRTPHPAAAWEGQDGPRMKVEALHDAQQQSEFFASLGQVDEAIAVLTDYLRDCGQKPVLAFLELLRIFHGVDMRVEYEDLQVEFQQTFGMDVMSFSAYREDRRELELFPAAITRIAASWPSPNALQVIEGILFTPAETARDLLSLEAYRELIWLYTLVQEIVHSTGLPAGRQLVGDTGLPNDHFLLPWALGNETGLAELSLDQLNRIDVASELSGFGLDIDLTAVSVDPRRDAEQPPDAAASASASASVRGPDSERGQGEASFDDVMESQSRNHRR